MVDQGIQSHAKDLKSTLYPLTVLLCDMVGKRGMRRGGLTASASANPHASIRGRALGIHPFTSFPRLSTHIDPTISAQSGLTQTHELHYLLRVPPRWIQNFGELIRDQKDDLTCFKVHFYTSRLAKVTLKEESLSAVLVDLPNIFETMKAPFQHQKEANNALKQAGQQNNSVNNHVNQDTSSHTQSHDDFTYRQQGAYYKVADLTQMLLVLDPDHEPFHYYVLHEWLPTHVRSQVLQIITQDEESVSLEDFISESTDPGTVFGEERGWALWPHGLTPPMYNILFTRKTPQGAHGIIMNSSSPSSTYPVSITGTTPHSTPPIYKYQMSASQTAEALERIVKRLLEADDKASALRVTLVHDESAKKQIVFTKGDEHLFASSKEDMKIEEYLGEKEKLVPELEDELDKLTNELLPIEEEQVERGEKESSVKAASQLDVMIRQLAEHGSGNGEDLF